MNSEAALSFAKWLSVDQPELFVALYKRALPTVAKGALGDFTDILSSIGNSLSSAVTNVGSYLTSSQGMDTIGKLGAAYLNTKASQNAVATNLQRAQSGLQAAPIQTVFNPSTQTYEAVVAQPTGQFIPLNTSVRSALLPAGMPTWVPWAIGGAGLLLVVLLLRR